ncbi:unnamed protein product [Bursaphelenchus okinawaensis]|uniref:Uncharacterized protein n=1 Tax=Bursaphelenchus okinawaensis TaxID=465554 RepID=A0A811K5L1_9BILA|nr:unnamed protein product [Bursaphelenchus okinawaensis]CAG9091221.1 unnamed protein product [Bursaphelenchus okinawaensis]
MLLNVALQLVIATTTSLRLVWADYEPASYDPINIPLAPYNVKLYCKSGKVESYPNMTKIRPSKCPTASTSCGYFELKYPTNKTTGILDCVDSSVFISEQDEELGGGMNFNRLCSHKPMCHLIPTVHFNKQFLRYLARNHDVLDIPSVIKFCCYLNHVLLNKLIISGQKTLPSVNSTPVNCNSKKCDEGAIGCLTHTKTVRIDKDNHIYDYFDVKPVEIVWEEEMTDDDNYESIPLITSELPRQTTYCVYPHLNNELYRYCLMIYNEKLTDNCYVHNGHTVCCCFVGPNDTTCKLKHIEFPPPTTTEPTTTLIIPTESANESSTTNIPYKASKSSRMTILTTQTPSSYDNMPYSFNNSSSDQKNDSKANNSSSRQANLDNISKSTINDSTISIEPSRSSIVPQTSINSSTTTKSQSTSSSPLRVDAIEGALIPEDKALSSTRRPINNSTRKRPLLSTSYRKPRCRKKYVHEPRFKSKDDRSTIKVIWKCSDNDEDEASGTIGYTTLTGILHFTSLFIIITL